jgi:hypothetical protein
MQPKISNKKGYLIIELAFGLLLIAFCAGIGYQFTQRTYNRAPIELKMLCALIAQTSMYAIHHQVDGGINLDKVSNTFITRHESFKLESLSYGYHPQLYGPPTDPRKPLTHFNSFVSDRITCTTDGSISHGTIYLLDKSNNQYAITIPIVPFGSLRIYKAYAAKKWELLSIEW